LTYILNGLIVKHRMRKI